MIEVSAEEHRWKSVIDENETLEDFNKYVLCCILRPPSGKGWWCSRGEVFKRMAIEEARKRGYHAEDRDGRLYAVQGRLPLNLRLTKGRNIIRVDWQDGRLYCEFASGKVYEYPHCPEVWCINLLKSPYPDSLWDGYKKKIEAHTQEITLSGVS